MSLPTVLVENTMREVIEHSLKEYLNSKEYEESIKTFTKEVGSKEEDDSDAVAYYKHIMSDYKLAKIYAQKCAFQMVREKVLECNSLRDIVATLLRHAKAEGPEECAICIEHLTGSLHTLRCSHRFHQDCIERWLEKSDTCPYCRAVVVVYS